MAALTYSFLAMTTNAILATGALQVMPAHQPQISKGDGEDDPRWDAVVARDSARDGEFVFAVSSTGVYCRPSCPSRRPRRENVQFFRDPQEAEHAGYRACLRCRPKAASGNPRQQFVKSVCRYIEQNLDEPLTLAQLGEQFHQSP